MNSLKLEKTLVYISLGIQVFNSALYCANAFQMGVFGNWLVLLGMIAFLLMTAATLVASSFLKSGKFNKAGWILLFVGFAQIGSNPIFNVLCLLNVMTGTLLVAKNINLKVRGAK